MRVVVANERGSGMPCRALIFHTLLSLSDAANAAANHLKPIHRLSLQRPFSHRPTLCVPYRTDHPRRRQRQLEDGLHVRRPSLAQPRRPGHGGVPARLPAGLHYPHLHHLLLRYVHYGRRACAWRALLWHAGLQDAPAANGPAGTAVSLCVVANKTMPCDVSHLCCYRVLFPPSHLMTNNSLVT